MAISLLLADDSPTIAKILGMALQSDNYEIRSVLTAEEALRELETSPPAFFLVDLTLPGKNGYELAHHLRTQAKFQQTRILLLSSAFDPVDDAQFASSGADGVLAKPFDPAELRAKLKEVAAAPTKTLASAETLAETPAETPEAPASPPPATESIPDLGFGTATEGDADSILSSLLGGAPDSPPPAPSAAPLAPQDARASDAPPPPPFPEERDTNEPTTVIDLGDMNDPGQTADGPPVLDLSQSFKTPPGGTATIDFSALTREVPPPGPVSEAEAPVAPLRAPDEPLSANAAALAAFFAAEIEAKDKPAPPVATAPPAEDDTFDASLSSIEWEKGPEKASLSAWTNPAPPPTDAPLAAPPLTELNWEEPVAATTLTPPPKKEGRRPPTSGTGASSGGGSFLFDTGNSNFRFAEDYVQRITKSFTGNDPDTEFTPVTHAPAQPRAAEPAPFPRASDDRQPVRAPLPSNGGAWSPEEVQRIEQLVREEVQMVVREVAEKVIWEVVPELAENLIRKELDKVLKQLDDSNA